jgi:uncharacterized membrane protein
VSVLVPGAAILGVLTAIALIRGLQTRAFLSLQLAYVLGAVAASGRAVIDDVYPVRVGLGVDPIEAPALTAPTRHTVTWNGPPGLVQQLELRGLLAAAAAADVSVVFRAGVGSTLHPGAPLADIHGGELPDAVVRGSVVGGPERSFDQDPMFAFRLLADIALRALSPAVNDPATAVDAIDATEGLLRELAARDLAVTDITDGAGAVRIRLVLPTWEDFLRTAVEDLLPVAGLPMVLERLDRLLDTLLELSPPAHAALVELRERVAAKRATHRDTVPSR